jgi:hypothetical protein
MTGWPEADRNAVDNATTYRNILGAVSRAIVKLKAGFESHGSAVCSLSRTALNNGGWTNTEIWVESSGGSKLKHC